MPPNTHDKQAQLSAYRSREAMLARSTTLDSTRLIRRIVSLGPRAVVLGLDQVPGVVRVRLVDHGADGVEMPVGQAHVEVWGGRAIDVYAAVDKNRPHGVMVTVRVRHDWLTWHRLRGWVRWQLFRAFGDPRRSGP